MPTLKSIPKEYQGVAKEVIAAYADCTIEWDKAENIRNLHFRASQPVPAAVATEIMQIAVPRGYNEFTASLLGHIDGMVTLAREGSVCVYVSKDASFEGYLLEDENDRQHDGTTRLWWD